MDWLTLTAVIAIGFVAGFINIMAGSGSLLTLPLLIFLGLPPHVANGTNRIAILLQSLVGVASFKQQKSFKWKEAWQLMLPTIIGSIAGAAFSLTIPEHYMEKVIGFLHLGFLILLVFNKKIWLQGMPTHRPTGITGLLVFFLIGFYGGFIQAGVGLLLSVGLVFSAGFDLVKSNAIKAFIILCYTPFALGVFILHGQIDYKLGLILATGSMAGAYVASRLSVKKGAGLVRYIMIFVVSLASLKLLGVFKIFCHYV